MPPPAPPEGDLLLVEIPPDFQAMRAADRDLAFRWRMHTRKIFEDLFARGYLVTDHVYLPEPLARSFYVLTRGEATLGV
jgi:predicted GNAT superfamily acetyltransferase